MEKAATPTEPEAADRASAAPEAIRTRPTQQGTVYLWTLGVFSIFLLGFKANLAFLLGAFALGCAGIAWVLARRNLADVHVTRDAPRRARVGKAARMAWTVRNPGRRTRVGIEVEDRPARGSKPVRVVAEMPVVTAGQSARCEADVVFARRGEVDLGRQTLIVASRYPLGLFRASGQVTSSGRILVRPVEGRISTALRRQLRGRKQVDARRRLARGEDEIYGIREYREGDDPRRIHWHTSARKGTLTVTEWRAEEGREAVIVLGRGAAPGGHAALHFERAVSAAATIWRACVRDRMHVTLELGDGAPIRSPGDGRKLERGLDALARVGAQGSRAPRRAMRRLGSLEGRRAVLFVSATRAKGLEAEVSAAAGRGGSGAVVPAWSRSLARWVKGVSA